jgi:methionyl-tRNA formyltransferase
VTSAPRFEREATKINWEAPAAQIVRQIRAFAPQPGAYTFWKGQMLKILAARELSMAEIPPEARPGTVLMEQGGPAIVTGEGALALIQLQMAGKRPMSGEVFMRGQRALVGTVLGST